MQFMPVGRIFARRSILSAFVLGTLTACVAPEQLSEGLDPDPNTPVGVLVTPSSATIEVNEPLQLTIHGANSRGEVINVDPDWDATGGTVTANGVFSSSVAGTFIVRGKWRNDHTKKDSSVVVVTSSAATPVSLSIAPGSISLASGGTQQFNATIGMSDGTNTPASATWTATGGTINSSGVYTAGSTAGSFRVIGSVSGGLLADTATVTITPTAPTLSAVVVTPPSASVASGLTQQFSATGLLSDGSNTPVAVTWFATGGSINAAGLYTAGGSTGSFRVIATQQGGTLADTSNVTVTAAVQTSITIAPANATVTSGNTQQFSVSGLLSNGNSNTPAVTYSATGGSITAGGLYTAGATTGTFRVIATLQGGLLADTSTVNITAPAATLDQVILTPASANLQSGAQQQFSVSGLMSDGSTITPAVTYNATGGTITAGGRYTAGNTAGTFRVIATQQGGTLADTSSITITVPPPVLSQVILTPTSATVQSGNTQQFSVSGLMSDGSTTTPTVTYSATGGSITAGGLYTAGGTAGSFRVIAVQQGGTLADTSTVTVTVPAPTLQAVVLTPASATVVGGTTRQFSSSGLMSDGSSSAVSVTYSATGGSITAGGLYTAGSTAGTFRVIAVQQGGTLADTSTVTVTAPQLNQVILTPASVSVQASTTQQFSVSGRLTDGSTTTVTVTYSATGGTITAGGLYTAGTTTGTFRVIAVQQGGTLADTSSVTVTAVPPVLTGVSMTPASATVQVNGTQQFSTTGLMSDGSTSSVTVTYSATGGTITAGGLYTAGSTAGSFRVIATTASGTFADTSNVTVNPAGSTTTLFSSDWTGGLLDGGKWTRWGGQGVLAAVTPTGLGFPNGMNNVLQVGMGTGSFDWVEADGKWTLPNVGESRAFRLYLRNDVSNISGGWAATHPVESKGTDGSISGNFYAWHIGSNTNGTFPIAFGTEAAWPRNYISTSGTTGSDVGSLQKGAVYRLEWKWTRTGSNVYTLDMRIADQTGTIIENNSTIKAWGGSTLASNNTGFPVDANFMTGIRVGINGGFTAAGTQNVYWGGFAVCTDWCGAYSNF